jgi:hypothetical protein
MFCLGAGNYTDIINFANMCSKYNFKGEITKIENWGTFDNFRVQDVMTNPGPEYDQAIDQLRGVSAMPHITIGSLLKQLL